MRNRRNALLIPLLALSWALACADQVTCDPGQVVEDGLCRTPPPSSDDDNDRTPTDGDAGNTTARNIACDGDAGKTGPSTDFGTPCQDAENFSDCGCPAPVCAVIPGQKEGFCTQTGCDTKDICPKDWTCPDLSAFGDYPATCLPPGLL